MIPPIPKNEQLEKRRFSLLMLLGGLIYPAWQPMYQMVLEHPYDPLWQRMALSVAFLAFGLAGHFVKFTKAQRDLIVYSLVWIMTIHFIFLSHQNHFVAQYLIGLIIVIEASHLVITSRRAYVAYQVFVLSATGVALFGFADASVGDRAVFYGGIITLALVNWVTHIQHAMVRQREHDRALFIGEQQAKMAALGDAAAGLAHEIKNILTIAIIYASTIAEKIGTQEQDLAGAARITKKTQAVLARMLKLTQSLQSFAHQPRELTPADEILAPLVEETIEVVSTKSKRWGVQIKVEIDASLVVHCIGNQLSQVLVNLLNNAIDATHELEDRWVRIFAEQVGNEVVIRVTDSGLGVPVDLRGKIMEPYFTTKPRGVGTGLGLSISRSLIENRGGSLTLDEDSPNTSFVIRLPVRTTEIMHSVA